MQLQYTLPLLFIITNFFMVFKIALFHQLIFFVCVVLKELLSWSAFLWPYKLAVVD